MNNKNKWAYSNKASNDRQTLVLTIIGIVLAAMQVLTGVSENQPSWQLALMISLAVITLILVVSLWVPKIYFGFWLRSKQKVLQGIYSKEKKTLEIEMIEISQNTGGFNHQASNNYENRRKVQFTYSMKFEKDFRFLTVKFAFKNDDGIELKFVSQEVILNKKGERLFLEFQFSNSRQVTENIHQNQNVPLVFGNAQMIFNLETKKLVKIIFNPEQDVMTLAYIDLLSE